MDRVSDEQLNVMIGFAADDVSEAPGPLNHCRWLALTELRERRAADKAEAVSNDQECPYCGEYHDKRTVCNDRYVKEFLRAVHDHKQQD